MYECSERDVAFSWCLLGPLFGQSIGHLLGAIILSNLECPWLFWILLIICAIAVTGALLFLQEAYVSVLLAQRQKEGLGFLVAVSFLMSQFVTVYSQISEKHNERKLEY